MNRILITVSPKCRRTKAHFFPCMQPCSSYYKPQASPGGQSLQVYHAAARQASSVADLLLLPLPGEVQQQFVVDVLLSLVRLRHLRLSSDKSTCSDVRKTLLEGVHSLDWFSASDAQRPCNRTVRATRELKLGARFTNRKYRNSDS